MVEVLLPLIVEYYVLSDVSIYLYVHTYVYIHNNENLDHLSQCLLGYICNTTVLLLPTPPYFHIMESHSIEHINYVELKANKPIVNIENYCTRAEQYSVH